MVQSVVVEPHNEFETGVKVWIIWLGWDDSKSNIATWICWKQEEKIDNLYISHTFSTYTLIHD